MITEENRNITEEMLDLYPYIEAHASAEPAYLEQVAHRTNRQVVNPRMMCGHVEGRLLSLLSQMVQPHRILELGTFTGYSALCLAEAFEGKDIETHELVTIDHNDELEDLVQTHLGLTPLGRYVKTRVGDALEQIAVLREEIERGEAEPFDLVFVDADKRQYLPYLEAVMPIVRAGGYILADNTLWDGHIADPAYDKDAQTLGLRAFNDYVAAQPSLTSVILPLRDGLTIIRVGHKA